VIAMPTTIWSSPSQTPLRVPVVGAEEAGVRAEQHHPLEADVEHAGALGDRLADRREHERHAGHEAARDDARPEGLGHEVVIHWVTRSIGEQ
jgi:hypothetical protein